MSNAGGLGGIGSLFRSPAAVKRDIDVVKKLTNKPYAINHIPQALDAETFRYTLATRPKVISFTLADPGDMVKQAHDVGSFVMVQVTTVAEADTSCRTGRGCHQRSGWRVRGLLRRGQYDGTCPAGR